MDNNKLKILKEVEYQLVKCCGNCEFSRFHRDNLFGVCDIKTYEHLKHTEKERRMSIHKYGCCKDYEECFDVERDNFFNYLK